MDFLPHLCSPCVSVSVSVSVCIIIDIFTFLPTNKSLPPWQLVQIWNSIPCWRIEGTECGVDEKITIPNSTYCSIVLHRMNRIPYHCCIHKWLNESTWNLRHTKHLNTYTWNIYIYFDLYTSICGISYRVRAHCIDAFLSSMLFCCFFIVAINTRRNVVEQNWRMFHPMYYNWNELTRKWKQTDIDQPNIQN